MGCECGGYCHRCRGMIWSFVGILILLNAFIWPKWLGLDGWIAFVGILLMLMGVWKSFVHGCSCPKDACCKPEAHKELHVEAPMETHADLPAVPQVHHVAPPVRFHKPIRRRK